MKGYPGGEFQPDGTMTRAEFAAVMIKAFPNAPVVRDEPQFSDVSPDFWGWSAINRAYSRGFLSGYPGNQFKPAQSISRAQAMIVIAKTQSQPTQQSTAAAADAVVLRDYFKDAQTIPLYARPGIATATRSGLVVNYPEVSRLRPNDSITRGEATALLCRLSEDGSDARYYVDTRYIAAFGDPFDLDGVPKTDEQSELTLLATADLSTTFFSQRLKLGNRLFFIDHNSGEVTDLWQTDGTAAGTQIVRSLDDGGDRTINTKFAEFIGVSEERLWLLTRLQYEGSIEKRAALWSSDGTASRIQEAKDFSPALAEALSQAAEVYAGEGVTKALDDRIPLFISTEREIALWMTDGKSSASTQKLATFSPDLSSYSVYSSQQVATTDNYLFFVAAAESDTGFSKLAVLWRTDGTAEGTVPLQTMGELSTREAIFAWNNQVYFTATTPEAGREVWVSDGTERGTQLLQDIYAGPKSSGASVIGTTDTELFLLGNSSTDRELWATTGTPESTRLVKRLDYPEPNRRKGAIYPSDGGRLLFDAGSELSGELWATDGTELGTRPIMSAEVSSSNAAAFKNRFFFSTETITGEELWASSGYALGTSQLADLTPGEYFNESNCADSIDILRDRSCRPRGYVSRSTSPRSLTVLGNDLYFLASDNRLFRTDGTVGGTELIDAFGSSSRFSSSLVKLDEQILFATYGDRSQLWAIKPREASIRSGFKRHTSPSVFAIDYPQNWYVKDSEREYVSIWNQQPSRQPSFPPGFAKTEVSIRAIAFEDVLEGNIQEGRGGYDSGEIVRENSVTVGGRDAYRLFLRDGENGEDTITTLIRYSDTQTATITSFYTSGETENISSILQMHQSFKAE